ncbi:MAG: helix-turn-helix domain-containing protein [Streptosporangiaceae bacterium]|nr:helix-turn-helix domain-containing protein [Streptosporangiaceae bacterium]
MVLACPACRNGQLVRRGDPLCQVCIQEAKETVPWPRWVFDSPLLRRALADLNVPAVPAIVRAACGLSQRDLAGIVGWSPAALSYYERGQREAVFDIRELLQFADAVGMPREILLPLIVADPEARLAAGTQNGPDVDVDRRGLGALIDAAAATVLPKPAVSAVVKPAHVRYWQACADTLYIHDHVVGGTALLLPALRQWQLVRQSLNGGDPGPALLTAAGGQALCTGWIAQDGGRLPVARSLYGQARELAGRSGDTEQAVHALTSLSMLHAELSRTGPGRDPARRALRLAFQAAEEGRYLPIPRLHALIALRQASAASLLGDKAAFKAGIARARRELDRGQEDGDPPQWLRFVDHAEITGVEARGFLNVGEADHSALLYRTVLASGLSPRNRACYGAGLAGALLKQGARREAVAAALDVLPALEGGVTSIRCLNRLRLVRLAAATVAGAEEFCDRFDVIDRALALARDTISGDSRGARRDIPA